MNDSISESVARLDGYLAGISSIDGNIRSYSAFAYLIECKNDGFDKALEKYFSTQGKLSFSYINFLDIGLRELENELRDVVLKDVFYSSSNGDEVNSDRLMIERKKIYFI